MPLTFRASDLDKLVAAGVRTLVVFESWTDVEAHAVTTHGKRLNKLVRACHDRGLKVLLYFGFLISDLAPEWQDFGKECLVLPKGGYPVYHTRPQPDQSAWRVCLRSPWQDFVVAGIARVMKEFDVDGVYLDGTEYPFSCCNALHGCGVAQADGGIAPTYPIFAARSAMRRIYHAVRSRKPDGQINVHNSTCMTIPSLGWATSYWDGEQFGQFLDASGKSNRMPMSLDAFRTEFMGHPWGVPAEFLCYSQPETFDYKQSWSFCLLHDVPVRPFRLTPDLQIASAIWRAMDDFGRREAEWIPYWRNEAYVSTSPDGVHASLYRHTRNGALLVLSNASRETVGATLRLNLKALGMSEVIESWDPLASGELRWKNGRFTCELGPLGWKLIRLRAAGASQSAKRG